MRAFGTTSLHELFGDLVILRNLEPFDRRLPGLAEAWQDMGLPGPRIPRKHEPDYARASVWFVKQARALDLPGVEVRELLFIGDTAMADGNAFRNLAQAGGWRGWCFIGNERLSAPPALTSEPDRVTLGNRWALLADWLAAVQADGARLDQHTAVVVDMDKTALAARGRNALVIDNARVEGLHRTAAGLLGEAFRLDRVQAAHDELKDPAYHPFTADNQDYLAYICLAISAGLVDLPTLVAQVRGGEMRSFEQFIAWADQHQGAMPAGLRAIHQEVYARVQAGDPTPFKAFRLNEYLATVERFGRLPADAPLDRLLAEQVCVTQEVREVSLWLRGRGCLVLSMSDKPDEATLPTPALAAQGYLPLHRAPTTAVGESIVHRLAAL
ncbi:MAG: hypothetical protein NZ528_12480 [Caldilineales bacterium]|nr:hypothetical protein [Caldilineales bacterium]MDW8318745.1 hypothetical protein [Anaerolineae bacterium]